MNFTKQFYRNSNVFNFPVFRKTSRYKYGQGFGDVLRGIVQFILEMAHFFKPVATKGVQSLLKADSEAIKEGATIKDVNMFTLTFTVAAVLGATVDQVASKHIEMPDNTNDTFSLNPPFVVPECVQVGSGKKRHSRSVYKKTFKRTKY